MGLLDRIFGGKKATVTEAVVAPPCTHLVLVPKWDAAADIGSEDKATSFDCEACGDRFSPAEARSLRETEAQRVRDSLDGSP